MIRSSTPCGAAAGAGSGGGGATADDGVAAGDGAAAGEGTGTVDGLAALDGAAAATAGGANFLASTGGAAGTVAPRSRTRKVLCTTSKSARYPAIRSSHSCHAAVSAIREA